MGKHRWWLKPFFYLLDVGTSNALILHRETMQNTLMNVVQCEKALVNIFVGLRISSVEAAPTVQHKLVRVEGEKRSGCAYCNAFGNYRRTRFACQHPQCNLPLCSVGSNCQNQDCFALAHSNEVIRKALVCRFVKMQQKSNNRIGTRRANRNSENTS